MNLARTVLCAGLLANCLAAAALESDSEQPIYIESNSATYDERKGISIYTGDVQVTQGSMHLDADELTVYLKDGKIDKWVATGNPARFKQTRPGKEEIKAKSQRAEFYAEQSRLILIDKAMVWQGENTTTSDRIEYDTKNAIVSAGQKSSDAKRVRVTLQPKNKKGE